MFFQGIPHFLSQVRFPPQLKCVIFEGTPHFLSQKKRNKTKHSENGNGKIRNSIVIGHWNMGPKYWSRKTTEVEAITIEYQPDVFFVSESNLLSDLSDFEKNIPGYSLFVPKTAMEQKVARLVLLVKDEFKVEIKSEYMDKTNAAIWLKISARGRKSLLVAGIYREHKYMLQDDEDESGTDDAQNERWYKFINTWTRAAVNQDTVIVGDVNLDFLSWSTPISRHSRMIEKMKNEVETLGLYTDSDGTHQINGRTNKHTFRPYMVKLCRKDDLR